MAVDLSLPFLGKLPLDPRIGKCAHILNVGINVGKKYLGLTHLCPFLFPVPLFRTVL